MYVTPWHVAVQDHGEGRGDGVMDVDPEIIRKGVRSLMQQVAQIERERVRNCNYVKMLVNGCLKVSSNAVVICD